MMKSRKKKERKRSLCVFLPLFIYAIFVILSTVNSANIEYSLYGAIGQQEPLFVLLGYVIVALYAYLVINTLDDVKQMTNAALCGAFVMTVIGVLQAIGKDPLTLEAVQRFFVDVEKYGVLELTFPVGQAYGTLYNPNYVGSYVALYFPLMVVGFLISRVFNRSRYSKLYKSLFSKPLSIKRFLGTRTSHGVPKKAIFC